MNISRCEYLLSVAALLLCTEAHTNVQYQSTIPILYSPDSVLMRLWFCNSVYRSRLTINFNS